MCLEYLVQGNKHLVTSIINICIKPFHAKPGKETGR